MPEQRNIRIEDSEGNSYYPHAKAKTTFLGSGDDIEKAFTEHQAENASTTKKGHVQLSSSTSSDSETMAATSKAVKTAYDKADAHANKKDNPHAVTKDQVGLTNVQDFGIATQAEAEAGTATNKYMTPQRVKQAITNVGGVALGDGDYAGKKYTLHVDKNGLFLKEV